MLSDADVLTFPPQAEPSTAGLAAGLPGQHLDRPQPEDWPALHHLAPHPQNRPWLAFQGLPGIRTG